MLWGYGDVEFFYECLRPNRVHEVCRDLVILHNRVEQLSSLKQEADMKRVRFVPGKHFMADLMLELKDSEVNA